MAQTAANAIISDLRDRIQHLESGVARPKTVLPFGVRELDERLPGGGLAYGAIHEFAGGGAGAVDGAAAAMFAGGIAARTKGKIVWCLARTDLFAPALAQVGLHPDRVIYVEAIREKYVLEACEEALRFGGLGAVVAETVRLPMVISRRLQLAAEGSGTIGLLVRRWRRQTEAGDFGHPATAATRWRISVLPSEPLPVPGVGRARWLAELIRVKAGESADFEIGACDAQGRISFLSDAGDGSDQTSRSVNTG
ncbi:ImuA family protein [Rhizobium leguminosarum]|uniref:ImuA family protein n=1 Tax=Rhizobium leguminosarum TaxID=384 RepID=UPI003F9E53DF